MNWCPVEQSGDEAKGIFRAGGVGVGARGDIEIPRPPEGGGAPLLVCRLQYTAEFSSTPARVPSDKTPPSETAPTPPLVTTSLARLQRGIALSL